jgi:peptidylprolyl isomerase
MKLLRTLLLVLAAPLAAQTTTPAKPAVHSAATTAGHTAVGHTFAAQSACVKLPQLSPKIPALPAGAPCAKALYTISLTLPGKLDYVSPMMGPGLGEYFGLVPISFSLGFVDTKIGTGAPAAAHKFLTVNYTGYLTDGTKFDSSFDHAGDPFVIQLGEHGVIPGWDTGFDGMRVGGKRRLFIPYELAYGANGKPPTIPAKSELIFDVELVSQSDTDPRPKPAPAPPAAATPPAGPATPQPPATGATPLPGGPAGTSGPSGPSGPGQGPSPSTTAPPPAAPPKPE